MDVGMVNENQNEQDIIKIAKSYNIKTKGNKSEIIKQINKYIKEKKENKLQTKEIQFKSKIDDLPIKNIEISERLFWKIFKNKVIFKNIFANFHHSFLNSYHCINDISWMIKNNHIGLLKDKVFKNSLFIRYGDYLTKHTINTSGNNKKNNDNQVNVYWYEHIFNSIKDDSNFYQHLFSNYNKYFLNDFYHIVLSSIKYGCLVALKVILEDGYYGFDPVTPSEISVSTTTTTTTKTTKSTFEKSIPTSKINNPSVTRIQLITNAIRGACIDSRLKIYRYLTEDYLVNYLYLSKKEKKEIIQLLIASKFFRCVSSSGKRNSMKFLLYLFDSNETFKQIIKDRPTGTMLQNEIQCNLFSKEKSILKIFSLSNLIESVKYFKLFSNDNIDWLSELKFTKEQLKNKTISILFNRSETYRTVIKLINTLCLNVHFSNYDIELLKFSKINSNHFRLALKYGNHSLYKKYEETGGNKYFSLSNNFIPFKYCQNNKEKKVEFIKGIIHPISENRNDNPHFVLHFLVTNDDINLLEIAIQEYGGISQVASLLKPKDFIYSHLLKSSTMLEFCFKRFPKLFEEKHLQYWYSSKRIDLLRKFEQLVGPEEYNKLLISLTRNLNFKNYPTLYKRFYEFNFPKSSLDFPSTKIIDETILQISKPILNQQHFENIKFLIENTKSIINSYQPFQEYSYTSSLDFVNTWEINLFDWLFSFNDGEEIKSGRCILDFDCLLNGLILTNRLNDKNWISWVSSKLPYSVTSTTAIEDIFKIVISLLEITQPPSIIDQIFNFYFLPNINTSNREEYLENYKAICSVLDLKLFKYIYYNYSRFLTIKNQNDYGNDEEDGLFTLKELQFLIINAEKDNLFNLIDFFNNIGIIKK
ncbi:hypothetical protein ACTA71_000509 [Dictyostelium dimigraforme]